MVMPSNEDQQFLNALQNPSMTSVSKQRLQALSEQLTVKPADPGTFEDIPKICRIAGDSAGPYGPLSSLPILVPTLHLID